MLLVAGFAGASATLSLAEDSPPTPEQARFFETKVRPVLAEHCTKCHGATKQKAGLQLDNRAAVLAGGDSGPAVVPGNLEEKPAAHRDQPRRRRPQDAPSKKLDARHIAGPHPVGQDGCPWPGSEAGPTPVPHPRKGAFTISDQDRGPTGPFSPFDGLLCPGQRHQVGRATRSTTSSSAGPRGEGVDAQPAATKQELIRRTLLT